MFRRLHALPILCALFCWALFSAQPRGQTGGAAAQNSGTTILGSVVDAALSPLAGVAVTLERDGRVHARTSTAADGSFRFANVAAGTYRIKAEQAGFPVVERELQVTAGAAAVRMPIVMARPGEKLDAVADREEANRTRTQPSPTAPPPAQAGAAAPPLPQTQTGVGAGGGAGRGGGAGYAAASQAPVRFDEVPYFEPAHAMERNDPWSGYRYRHSGERYAHVEPNRFQPAWSNPLSTFGADVDTASYTNVRRFLSQGQLPPRDAVRVEEFVNYFRFDYDVPRDGRPIALTTEIGDCPWAPGHKLVLIGARARSAVVREISGRNIVLLLDVSGSMAPAERLPLIKSALQMFVETLRADDRLAIVTYAGTSGVALHSTPVRQRDVIQRAIASLQAGGSTNGGQGLITAYRVAREAFIPGGVNRVILGTDGDFNVGITSQHDLLNLIQRERESGIFLSVLGVGSGNLKDATMEMLADRGNGHYAYLDSIQEARRVLVREADATVENVAKDVKFQVEFNPSVVSAWKLIGYENRLLAAQDFNDDRKDGGEMGAGHTVTVLYEVVPVGIEIPEADRSSRADVDPLRYQSQPDTSRPAPPPSAQGQPRTVPSEYPNEWLTVKARYKTPEGEVSQLITRPVQNAGRVRHLPLASAVAELGLLLRSGRGHAEQWDGLVARVSRLQAPPSQTVEFAGFAELVAIARSLSR